jgi:hypothetical protein
MMFALDEVWSAIAAGGPVAVVLGVGLAVVWTKLWCKFEALEAQNSALAKQMIDFLRELVDKEKP